MSTPPPAPAAPPPDRAALMRDPNYRWMLAGAAISMLGDQFTLVALPWLVLKMTGDTRVLGTVLALVSVPRAQFILIGGALVDRHSPQRVLMLTKVINTALLGLLAALVLGGNSLLWPVYLLALTIGLSTAFSIPSGSAMLPQIVAPPMLGAANSMMLSLRQLSMFVGPLLAGGLIAVFGHSGADAASGLAAASVTDASGLGFAFAADAASFALSAWTLSRVRTRAAVTPPGGIPAAQPAVLAAVAQGLRHVWNDVALRSCFLYWGAVAVLIQGPLHIAVPVLADTLGLGAAALGLLMGAHGAGTLAGMAVSGAKPGLRLGTLGLTMLAVDALIGALCMPLGLVQATWQGVALMAAIGVLGGFVQVTIFTWMQQRVPAAMMGRAMSLFMFIFMGLVPMSSAATGWLMRSITLPQLFMASGGLLVAIAAAALMGSRIRWVTDGGAQAVVATQ